METLATLYKLKVLFDENLSEEDVKKIIFPTKEFIKFSSYELKQIQFPKKFVHSFNYLYNVVYPRSNEQSLDQYFEGIRNKNEILCVLTGKFLLVEKIIDRFEFTLSLGYAGSHHFYNGKIRINKVALISTAGLEDKYIERARGTLLHEIGEIFIPFNAHCDNKSCFMNSPYLPSPYNPSRFKEIFPILDRQIDFCERCKRKLKVMIEEMERNEILDEEKIKNLLRKIEK